MRFSAKWLKVATVLGLGVGLLAGGAEAQDAKRLRVAGEAQQAKVVSSPAPVYPVLAKRARIEGTVRLQVIIAKDGSVNKVEVLSGHAVLGQAASEAVQKWRYKPTEVNGESVEVVTNIDVTFKMT